MADKPTIVTEEGELELEQEHEEQEAQKLLPAQDVLPESLLIIPLYDRPMFPKMMGPIMVEDPRIQQMILQAQEKGLVIYLGLLLVKQSESGVTHAPQSIDDFCPIGVAAKVVQISPPAQDQPLQLVAQAQERFEVKQLTRQQPVFKALVKYLPEVAIIDCIKELVTLNPLFKEGLGLLLDRINVSDPSALADFAASMTTSSGAELQEILETTSIQKRLERVLILLKNEIEISKLKADISKRIEERLSKQQREFFLKQQMDI